MRRLGSGLFFFGLSAFIIWESLRVGVGTLNEIGSGFLSFYTGVILSVLSLVLIYEAWRLRDSRKIHSHRGRAVLALIILFVYSLVLNILGFFVATFFLVGILFRLGEPRPWWALLGMSALVTFLAYIVFGILLHVYFPTGLLGI